MFVLGTRSQGGISTLTGVVHRLEMRFSPDSHGELRASLVRRGGEMRLVCFNFPFSGRVQDNVETWYHMLWPFQILTTLRIFDEYFHTGRTRAERHQQKFCRCAEELEKNLPFLIGIICCDLP